MFTWTRISWWPDVADDLTIPTPAEAFTLEDGRPNPTWWRFLQRLGSQFNQTTRDLSATDTGLATKAAKSQPWSESFIIELPEDKDYPFLKLGYAAVWTEVETDALSGSCTLTVKIGATPLGGTANAASSSRETQAHTTANTMAATDDLTFTVSANADCQMMSVTLRGTRTFA